MFNFKNYDWKRYNVSLVIVVILLSLVGAFCLRQSDGDAMFKRQLIGIVLGLIIVAVVSIIDYHFLLRFVFLYYFVVTGMLFAVKFTGLGTDNDTGSYRWISIAGLTLQPSELAKIAVILVLAWLLTKLQDKMDKFYSLLLAILIAGIPTFLVLIQTDLSSSMVMMFITVIMVFAAGLSYKIIVPILAVGLPSALVLFWYVQQPYQILLDEYQQGRIISFLHPEAFANSLMYQQNNSVQAIASGRLYGKLLMDSDSAVRGYNYVYVNESDFIFSVIGEELGFLGGFIVILLLSIVILKCLSTAKKSRDFTGQMIATGVSAMFMFQVFANIGVATKILPNTGLPLPFLSYGLSSLMSSMIAIGLVINVGIQRKNIRG